MDLQQVIFDFAKNNGLKIWDKTIFEALENEIIISRGGQKILSLHNHGIYEIESIVEKNNDNSPIFNMSPLSLVKFAEIIDIASSYGAIIENKVELPPLPSMSSISSLTSTSSLSISPPKINIIPLTSLSSMKNSLYERRMKAKEQQEK